MLEGCSCSGIDFGHNFFIKNFSAIYISGLSFDCTLCTQSRSSYSKKFSIRFLTLILRDAESVPDKFIILMCRDSVFLIIIELFSFPSFAGHKGQSPLKKARSRLLERRKRSLETTLFF